MPEGSGPYYLGRQQPSEGCRIEGPEKHSMPFAMAECQYAVVSMVTLALCLAHPKGSLPTSLENHSPGEFPGCRHGAGRRLLSPGIRKREASGSLRVVV